MKRIFNLTQLLAFGLFLSFLILPSCKKEQSGSGEMEAQASRVSSESDGEAENLFNGIFDDVMGVNDEVGLAGTGIFGRSYSGDPDGNTSMQRGDSTHCFTVTVIHLATTPFPKKVIIDFGTTGCVGRDGRTRKGKIIIVYTGRLITPGAMATTTFENFYVNDIKVEGTHIIKNTSTVNVNRQYTVEVIDGKLTKPNGNYVNWNSEKIITQIEGLVTANIPIDDIFKIEGHARGTALRGNLLVAWQSTITVPLIKRFNCRWIVAGRIRTVRLNTSNTSPWIAILDFGNGTCDNQATLTINGVTYQITLQ
jgi:hypothetical protein